MTPIEELLVDNLKASQRAHASFLRDNEGLDRAFETRTLGEFIHSRTTGVTDADDQKNTNKPNGANDAGANAELDAPHAGEGSDARGGGAD
jgi:hypothetical protein